MDHLGRDSLRDDFRAHYFAGLGDGDSVARRGFYRFSGGERIYPGAVLVALEDLRISVLLRVDARDTAALPV